MKRKRFSNMMGLVKIIIKLIKRKTYRYIEIERADIHLVGVVRREAWGELADELKKEFSE